MSRSAGRIAAATLLLAAAACSGSPTPEHPAAGAALSLFELAHVDEPSAEQLALLEADSGLKARAALLDALEGLALPSAPRLVAVEEAGANQVFVDLSAALGGGGEASFTVRLRSTGPEGWVVTWFQGPGVEWPARSESGIGLSSSNPPR